MPLCILIVEDDPLIALDLETILLDVGHKVLGIAGDMYDARQIALRNHVDVAIMDVSLARGTNGLETARHLRQDHGIPSLFVSAHISEKVQATALSCCPLGFIGKPYRADEIKAALGQARERDAQLT